MLEVPFPRAWWIEPGRVLGGAYPGDPTPSLATAKLTALVRVGVRHVVSLQEPDECARFRPYLPELRALAGGEGVGLEWSSHPIPDMGVPTEERMRAVLDTIGHAGGVVYVHCWGGHGRTGTVAGCWLRERGRSAAEALRSIRAARAHDPHLAGLESPQTSAQRAFVTAWRPSGAFAGSESEATGGVPPGAPPARCR
jgi:protein tyrosine phosphatase (PTP) superfamily phosphohydrolase (DUF442 family)